MNKKQTNKKYDTLSKDLKKKWACALLDQPLCMLIRLDHILLYPTEIGTISYQCTLRENVNELLTYHGQGIQFR